MGDSYQSSSKVDTGVSLGRQSSTKLDLGTPAGRQSYKGHVWREIEKNLRKKRRATFEETPYSDTFRNISVEIGKYVINLNVDCSAELVRNLLKYLCEKQLSLYLLLFSEL